MRTFRSFFLVTCIALAIAAHLRGVALAASSDEAAKLRTSLTPFGAERAASADGRIPAWTGVVTRAGYRDDPFAKESPVVTITAKNAAQYADHLTDGTKALLAKYPDYKIVVYPTHRTAVAPQWVYDATFQNALHGRMNGYQPQGVYGGIPFPLPATGVEAMWNHILRWRAPSWQYRGPGIQTTADGRHVTTVDVVGDWQMPYYFKNEQARFNGEYWLTNIRDLGPPIRTGEAIVGREDLNDDKTRVWVYLAGQRRTRELPNACCDTPTPATAGVMAFDELDNWTGRLDRYDWKIVGKKELYVPYNDNGTNSASDLVQAHFFNPDRVRYELHRVWAVQATLRPGQRHQVPKAMFYLDEDTWLALLSDRWDAHGQLWKTGIVLPFVVGDLPGVVQQATGGYDLLSGSWYAAALVKDQADYYQLHARFEDDTFTPEAMMRGAR